MADEFLNKPSKIQPAIAGNIANPDEYNANITGQSKDAVLGIDKDGNYKDFDIGNENNNSLAKDINLREGYLLKKYNISNVLIGSKDPFIFQPSQGSELTIASGVITITADQHIVDTEGNAPSDNLDTINGGSIGQIIVLGSADTSRNIVIKHNAGNIITQYGIDITLSNINDKIALQYNGSNWIVLFFNLTSNPYNNWVRLSQTIASNQPNVDIVLPTDDYDTFKILVKGVYHANNNTEPRIRLSNNGGSSFRAGGGDYSIAIAGIGLSNLIDDFNSYIQALNGSRASNSQARGYSGVVEITSASSTSIFTGLSWKIGGGDGDNNGVVGGTGIARLVAVTEVNNAIRFFSSFGNIAGGTFTLYGIKEG